MTEWFKALSLAARCLSPLLSFESLPGHLRRLLVISDRAVVFTGYPSFLRPLQFAKYGRKSDDNGISKFVI